MLSTKPVSTRNDYPLSNLFTYATSVNPNLLCGICSEPLYDPIELECEHYFCRTCLTSWIENQKDSDGDVSAEEYMVVCPLDKTPHSFSKPHKPIARLIAAQLNELIVKCNSCGIPMQRHLFEKHYENDCEFRVITCEKEGCGESYVRREKDIHARNCHQKCKKEVRFQLPEYSNSSASSRKLEKQKAHSSPARSNSLAGRTSQSSSDSKFNASKEPSYQLGFFYEYYQGDFDEIPRFTELTPNSSGILYRLSIDENTEKNLLDQTGVCQSVLDTGNFAVRFRGFIQIPQDGLYHFYLNSNDGSKLYINNEIVIDNDGKHYAKEVEGQVQLKEGKCEFEVSYFHRNGKLMEGFRQGPTLLLSYYSPGQYWPLSTGSIPKQVIPDSNFFFDANDSFINSITSKDKDSKMPVANVEQLNQKLAVAESRIQALERTLHEQLLQSKVQQEAMSRKAGELETQLKLYEDKVGSVQELEQLKQTCFFSLALSIKMSKLQHSALESPQHRNSEEADEDSLYNEKKNLSVNDLYEQFGDLKVSEWPKLLVEEIL